MSTERTFKSGDRVMVGRRPGTVQSPAYGPSEYSREDSNVYVKVRFDEAPSTVSGWFESTVELIEPTIEVGDTVLVAFEGRVADVRTLGMDLIRTDGSYGWTRHADATLVSKAEPTYTPGKLYRDADGLLLYRTGTDSPMATPWLGLFEDGYSTMVHDLDVLRPITEVSIGGCDPAF